MTHSCLQLKLNPGHQSKAKCQLPRILDLNSCRRWVSENKVPLRTHAPPTLVDVAAVAALLTSMVTELKKS